MENPYIALASETFLDLCRLERKTMRQDRTKQQRKRINDTREMYKTYVYLAENFSGMRRADILTIIHMKTKEVRDNEKCHSKGVEQVETRESRNQGYCTTV